jgi:hypothetical protein
MTEGKKENQALNRYARIVVKLCHCEEALYSTPQILNHCSSPSSIHSYPTTTAGFKIRSILPTQKSNTPGGLKHETQSTDIPPPPCVV